MDKPKADSKPKSKPSVPYSGKIIDIHTHVFNLKYLPVAGIIVRYSNDIIPHSLAVFIEWLLLRRTKSVFETDSFRMSSSQTLKAKLKKPAQPYAGLGAFDLQKEELIEALSDLVMEQDLKKENPLTEAIREFKEQNPDFNSELGTMKATETAENLFLLEGLSVVKAMLKKVFELMESAENHIRWFLFMMNDEETIYRHLVQIDAAKAERHLFMMMDVDTYFNKNSNNLRYKSHFDFKSKQILNMQILMQQHPSLIGFVAYSPADNGSFETVKTAISQQGFKGIKFYPPMGYKAYESDRYAKEITEFMEFYGAGDVPIFTHCNNAGFQANPSGKSGHCSNPKYWEQVLLKHPNMRLCLGHGGGGEGWFSKNQPGDNYDISQISAANIKDESDLQKQNWNHSYAAMVYKLCVEYPNVYCDASYLDEMVGTDGSLDPHLRENFRKRLLKCFETKGKYEFSKKIMYGSDWHMLFREGKNGVYLDAYREFYGHGDFAKYNEDFFYNNAKRFLKELPAE